MSDNTKATGAQQPPAPVPSKTTITSQTFQPLATKPIRVTSGYKGSDAANRTVRLTDSYKQKSGGKPLNG